MAIKKWVWFLILNKESTRKFKTKFLQLKSIEQGDS